nr:hypothetical protein [uncultured Dyadobacter sp.]
MKIFLRKLRFEIKFEDVALSNNYNAAAQYKTLPIAEIAEFLPAMVMSQTTLF